MKMKFKNNLLLTFVLAMLGLQACKKKEIVELEVTMPTKKSWIDTVEVFKFVIGVNGQTKLDWDWNHPSQTYVPVNYLNFLGGIVSIDITLPWKTQGNPLSAPQPDIKTEDGWDVVVRNFGTKEVPVNFPFLAIYNKKTAMLRCFIYNSKRISANDFVGKLVYYGANLENASFISGVDPHTTQADTYGSWINLDFEVPYNRLQQLTENDELGIDIRCFVFHHYNNVEL